MKEKIVVKILIILITASCRPVQAQESTKPAPRIGIISSTGTPGSPSPLLNAFQLGLQNLGYVDGKNMSIERRYAEGRLDRIPALVADLVQQKVDVLLAGSNVAIQAARAATKTIPIVMISTIDPVAAGYVKSIPHPAGNVTGLAALSRAISAKRLELLKQLLPKMSRLGVLWDGDGPGPRIAFNEYAAAARSFKLELRSLEVRGPTPDLSGAFQIAKKGRLDAILVVTNPLIGQHAEQIFDLAVNHRLFPMAEESRYVKAGGAISYGPNLTELYGRAAEHVVAILKGAKPGDLPVKLATRFETFININTAKQLGVVIPQQILIQADKVIQ